MNASAERFIADMRSAQERFLIDYLPMLEAGGKSAEYRDGFRDGVTLTIDTVTKTMAEWLTEVKS